MYSPYIYIKDLTYHCLLEIRLQKGATLLTTRLGETSHTQNKLISNEANCMAVLTTRFGETVASHIVATCTESADV